MDTLERAAVRRLETLEDKACAEWQKIRRQSAAEYFRFSHKLKTGFAIERKEQKGFVRKKRRGKRKTPSKNGVSRILAPRVGLEPTTCGLTVRRSTD